MFNIIKKYFIEIIVSILILFIFIISIFNRISGNKGTYTKNMFSYINAGNNNKPITNSSKNDSYGEKECRRILEKIFNAPFKKARPDWLNNDITGQNLELDCYNPQYKIACEYNGKQHYEYNSFFHKNKQDFQLQKYRDWMKEKKCQENGVLLINVPYTIKIDNIEWFLKAKISKIYNF